MKRIGFSFIGLALLTLVPRVFAGGGLNAILSPVWTTAFTGDNGVKVTAVVYTDSAPAPHNQGFVAGKEFVFEIENADPTKGQVCQTTKPISDNQGKVEGVCTAKKAGFLYVYLREIGSAQRTKNSTLKFIYPPGENPSINAITNTPSKTAPKELTPTATIATTQDTAETDKKIEGLEKQVELLTEKVGNQNTQMNAIQQLLEKIISFLEKIPFLNFLQSNTKSQQ